MAEEWGLVGGLFLILLFALLLRWGMAVALDAKDRFERLAAAGLTTTIFFYVAINLLMVMGLAPVVGIPLPLVSYGGSAMMTVMICLGMLMSIDRNTRKTTQLTPLATVAISRCVATRCAAFAAQAWTHSSVGRAADS